MLARQSLYARRCTESLLQLLEQLPAVVAARQPAELFRESIGVRLVHTLLSSERAFVVARLREAGVDLAALSEDLGLLLQEREAERSRRGPTSLDDSRTAERAVDIGLAWWLWRIEEHAASLGHSYLGPEHLLLAVAAEAGPALRERLGKHGITFDTAKAAAVTARTGIDEPEELPGLASLVKEYPKGARWDSPATGVPRRFGLGVMLLLTFLYAVLFAGMKLFDVHPLAFGLIAVLFTGVGLGQMLLFGGKYPRAASIWVGAVLFPAEILVAGIIAAITFHDDFVIYVAIVWALFGIPIGAFLGYVTGALSAGVFLLLELAAKRRGPAAVKEQEGPWDAEPLENGESGG